MLLGTQTAGNWGKGYQFLHIGKIFQLSVIKHLNYQGYPSPTFTERIKELKSVVWIYHLKQGKHQVHSKCSKPVEFLFPQVKYVIFLYRLQTFLSIFTARILVFTLFLLLPNKNEGHPDQYEFQKNNE